MGWGGMGVSTDNTGQGEVSTDNTGWGGVGVSTDNMGQGGVGGEHR